MPSESLPSDLLLGGLVAESFEFEPGLLDELAAAINALLQFVLSGLDVAKLLVSWFRHWIPRGLKSGS